MFVSTAKEMVETMSEEMTCVVLDLFQEASETLTTCCESWAAGDSNMSDLKMWSKTLHDILHRLRPVHRFLDLESMHREEQAFSHTAELVVFLAHSLRPETSAAAATQQLLEAEREVAWPHSVTHREICFLDMLVKIDP